MAVGTGCEAEQQPEVVRRHGGTALLDAAAAQVAAARAARDYPLWRAALFCARNLTRFKGLEGDGFRRRLLDRGGRAAEWLTGWAGVGVWLCCSPLWASQPRPGTLRGAMERALAACGAP